MGARRQPGERETTGYVRAASSIVERDSAALPDGTVRLYPDASHAVNGEYPERLRDDIADFVARHR